MSLKDEGKRCGFLLTDPRSYKFARAVTIAAMGVSVTFPVIMLLLFPPMEAFIPVLFVEMSMATVLCYFFLSNARYMEDVEYGVDKFSEDRTFRFRKKRRDGDHAKGEGQDSLIDDLDGLFARVDYAEDTSQSLIRNLSHELRTPLTSMRILAEGMLDGVFEPDKENLGAILAETERINELFTAMKRYSELSSEDITLVKCDASMPLLASYQRAQRIIASSGRSVDVQLKGVPSAEFNTSIMADSALLETLFDAIAMNAIEHADGMSTLEFSFSTEGQGTLKVSIADDGCGTDIPQNKLVQPFFMADDSHTSNGKSSSSRGGLGLALASAIMDSFGGEFKISSKEGVGTSVSMRFPIMGGDE